jgi:hypothetical protein
MLLPGRLKDLVRLGLGCAHDLPGLMPGVREDCIGLRSGLIADLPRGIFGLAAGSRGRFRGFGQQRVTASQDAVRSVQLRWKGLAERVE